MILKNNKIREKYPVLVCGDLHVPFVDTEMNEFKKEIKDIFDITTEIMVGDTFDCESISHFTNEVNPKSNFLKEFKEVVKWFKEYKRYMGLDNVYIVLGNHEKRILRFSEGLIKSSEFLEVLLSNEDYKIIPFDNVSLNGDWHFFHPNNCCLSLTHAKRQKTKYPNSHIGIAHQHKVSYSRDMSGDYFLVDMPCMADYDKFEYVKNMNRWGRPDKGFLVVWKDKFLLCDENFKKMYDEGILCLKKK